MPIFCFIEYTLIESFKKTLEIVDKFVNRRVRLFIHQTMSLYKTCWEEKIIRTLQQGYFFKNSLCKIEKFCKKAVLKNFVNWTSAASENVHETEES